MLLSPDTVYTDGFTVRDYSIPPRPSIKVLIEGNGAIIHLGHSPDSNSIRVDPGMYLEIRDCIMVEGGQEGTFYAEDAIPDPQGAITFLYKGGTSSEGLVDHNTFHNNVYGVVTLSGVLSHYVTIRNSIFTNNQRHGILCRDIDCGDQFVPEYQYNCLWSDASGGDTLYAISCGCSHCATYHVPLDPGYGDKSEVPRFCSAQEWDFRLYPDSPCIDAGNPSPPDPDGTPPDMGARLQRVGFFLAWPDSNATVSGEGLTFDWDDANSGGRQVSYTLYLSPDPEFPPGETTVIEDLSTSSYTLPDTVSLDAGTYSWKVTGLIDVVTETMCPRSYQFAVDPSSPRLYVGAFTNPIGARTLNLVCAAEAKLQSLTTFSIIQAGHDQDFSFGTVDSVTYQGIFQAESGGRMIVRAQGIDLEGHGCAARRDLVLAMVSSSRGGTLASPGEELVVGIPPSSGVEDTTMVVLTWELLTGDDPVAPVGQAYTLQVQSLSSPPSGLDLSFQLPVGDDLDHRGSPCIFKRQGEEWVALGGTPTQDRRLALRGVAPGTYALGSLSSGDDHVRQQTLAVSGYPNPSRDRVTISFSPKGGTATAGMGTVDIYDVRGRLVNRIFKDSLRDGWGIVSVQWEAVDRSGRPVASGVYFCRVKVGQAEGRCSLVLLGGGRENH